jgi:putative tricarboxylic transport membrane protein
MKPIVAGAAIAIAAAYAYGTTTIFVSPFADPAGPRAYPFLLAAMLVFGAVLLLLEWAKERRAGGGKPGDKIHWSPLLPVAAWTLAYILAFEPVGYPIATTIYLIVLMAFFNPGRTAVNVATSIAFAVVSYVILAKLLDAQLPAGALLELLPFRV